MDRLAMCRISFERFRLRRFRTIKDGGVWFDVYSSLYHQCSVYSATFAAMPHIVHIAESGTVAQRVAIMGLAGDMRISAYADESIPADLLAEFESAVETVKKFSLRTMQDAACEHIFDAQWKLGESLRAFGGLRYPKSGFVVQLGYLVIEGGRVESECPACGETMLARFDERGIVCLRITDGGNGIPEFAKAFPVNRSGYPRLISNGQAILAVGRPVWLVEDTPAVLAALAMEFDDELFAARILDLSATICCAYCGQECELSKTLPPRN